MFGTFQHTLRAVERPSIRTKNIFKKWKKGIDIFRKAVIIRHVLAGVAHPVERHLAKVEVASSSLVTRSIKKQMRKRLLFSFMAFVRRSRGGWLIPPSL